MPRRNRSAPAASDRATAAATQIVEPTAPRAAWPVRVYLAVLVAVTLIAVGVGVRQWWVATPLERSAQTWQNEQAAWTRTTRVYQASYQTAAAANQQLVHAYNRLLVDRNTLVAQYATALARAGRQDRAAAAAATPSAPAAGASYVSVPSSAPTTRVS